MLCPIKNTFSHKGSHIKSTTRIYSVKATILLVGNRKKTKYWEGSHIPVSEFGRYILAVLIS